MRCFLLKKIAMAMQVGMQIVKIENEKNLKKNKKY